jgi:hypothetical protein
VLFERVCRLSGYSTVEKPEPTMMSAWTHIREHVLLAFLMRVGSDRRGFANDYLCNQTKDCPSWNHFRPK